MEDYPTAAAAGKCPHDCVAAYGCGDCLGEGVCEHMVLKWECEECTKQCQHGKHTFMCLDCGRDGICAISAAPIFASMDTASAALVLEGLVNKDRASETVAQVLCEIMKTSVANSGLAALDAQFADGKLTQGMYEIVVASLIGKDKEEAAVVLGDSLVKLCRAGAIRAF